MVRKRKIKTNRTNPDVRSRGSDPALGGRRSGVYQLNPKWPYFNELKNLVLKIAPPSFPKIERGLARLGRVKLAVVTGVFLNLNDTRVDIMVVGDDIDFKRFSDFIKRLEGEAGTELRYVVLGTEEFRYRFNMFDRFVHDILEYPHRKVINRIGRLV